VHLEVLSRLSMLLMDDEFRTNLLDAADVTEFLAHIDEAERKKFPEEYGEEKQTQDQPEEGYRVLAVTACPTGIAHTYMAAESLENKAKEMGISIKVETNGSGGAKNVLTPEEIAQCECIIIAADKFGMGNPFSRFLKQVGDISFGMMFPILAGYIAMAIADRPALMPGIVGGLLAKSGMTMAAEEAGWVSSGFFGALIAGFAVAGALSMLFGCGSRAPHGGIFVIGIIDNPLLFLAAVAAGSVVAMLGIVLLKKPLAAKRENVQKKSEQKLRKVINKAQYIRTSYLSVEK